MNGNKNNFYFRWDVQNIVLLLSYGLSTISSPQVTIPLVSELLFYEVSEIERSGY